jgi:hypothetical protein
MRCKQFLKAMIIGLFTFFSYTSLEAQGPSDPGPDPDPTPVPFDGGISLVIAAGAGYAIKKKYDQRKKQKEMTGKP